MKDIKLRICMAVVLIAQVIIIAVLLLKNGFWANIEAVTAAAVTLVMSAVLISYKEKKDTGENKISEALLRQIIDEAIAKEFDKQREYFIPADRFCGIEEKLDDILEKTCAHNEKHENLSDDKTDDTGKKNETQGGGDTTPPPELSDVSFLEQILKKYKNAQDGDSRDYDNSFRNDADEFKIVNAGDSADPENDGYECEWTYDGSTALLVKCKDDKDGANGYVFPNFGQNEYRFKENKLNVLFNEPDWKNEYPRVIAPAKVFRDGNKIKVIKKGDLS